LEAAIKEEGDHVEEVDFPLKTTVERPASRESHGGSTESPRAEPGAATTDRVCERVTIHNCLKRMVGLD
jgi:hypothetical protein